MTRLSRREWGLLLLAAALVVGWAYDHIRYSHRLRRTVESEQYFKERLFEAFDAQAASGTKAGNLDPREADKKNLAPASN